MNDEVNVLHRHLIPGTGGCEKVICMQDAGAAHMRWCITFEHFTMYFPLAQAGGTEINATACVRAVVLASSGQWVCMLLACRRNGGALIAGANPTEKSGYVAGRMV